MILPILKLKVLESISFKVDTTFTILPTGLQGKSCTENQVTIGKSTGCIDVGPEEQGMGARHALIKYDPCTLIISTQILYYSGFRKWLRHICKNTAAAQY